MSGEDEDDTTNPAAPRHIRCANTGDMKLLVQHAWTLARRLRAAADEIDRATNELQQTLDACDHKEGP